MELLEQNPNLIFIVLMMGVAYFTLFRPQQKRQKEAKQLRENIKKGDKIVSAGGIIGKVHEVNETKVIVDVDRGTKLTFEKTSITGVLGEE
jgi:preprotein translocase subunit YajC